MGEKTIEQLREELAVLDRQRRELKAKASQIAKEIEQKRVNESIAKLSGQEKERLVQALGLSGVSSGEKFGTIEQQKTAKGKRVLFFFKKK